MTALLDTYCGFSMAETAENLTAGYGITRRASDEYALRSQQAAEAAYRPCYTKEEIVPMEVKQGRKTQLVSEDDHRTRRLRHSKNSRRHFAPTAS